MAAIVTITLRVNLKEPSTNSTNDLALVRLLQILEDPGLLLCTTLERISNFDNDDCEVDVTPLLNKVGL